MSKERCEHCGRLKYDQHGNEPPHPVEQCRDRLRGHRDALHSHSKALLGIIDDLHKQVEELTLSNKSLLDMTWNQQIEIEEGWEDTDRYLKALEEIAGGLSCMLSERIWCAHCIATAAIGEGKP